jgi:large subunit ribosomal protein L15
MRLHNLVRGKGENRPKKRLGRGPGSGHGKTSGRGHKGQHARSGSSIRPGFESGHIPLYRKLPKRGFNQARFQTEWNIVNVGDLERLVGITEVDAHVLMTAGFIKKIKLPLKILGTGELTKSFTVKAVKFSATAREKIEKAGGKVIEEAANVVVSETLDA